MDSGEFAAGRGFNKTNLAAHASTTDGLAWLAKYLHPPGVSLGTVKGMPDRNCMSSSTMEWTLQHTIVPPAGITAAQTWSCQLVTTPSLETPGVALTWVTTDAGQVITTVLDNDFIDLTTVEKIKALASRSRLIALSSTIELNAPAVADQGAVFAANIRAERTQTPMPAKSAFGVSDELETIHTLNGSDVTTLSAKSYTGKAKHGVYLPATLSQADNPYRTSYSTDPEGTDLPFQRVLRLRRADGTSYVTVIRGMPWADFGVGMVLFTGLSASATLAVKSVVAAEAIPSPRSAWLPFLSPGAAPDSKAVDSAATIRHSMPDAFPAAANFWGALGSALLALAPTVLTGISHWLTGRASTQAQEQRPQAVVRPVPAPRRRPAEASGQARQAPTRIPAPAHPPSQASKRRRRRAAAAALGN